MKKLFFTILALAVVVTGSLVCNRCASTPDAAVEIAHGMARLPGGTFMMGSPASESGRDSDETRHEVAVAAFWMGQYEVTQEEWRDVMGTDPSCFKGRRLPVESVTWFDAVEFCNEKSRKEELTPVYTISGTGSSRTVTWNRNADGYRLPTEAEWEYACRAATVTPYIMGTRDTSLAGYANVADRTVTVKYSDSAWSIVDINDGYADTAPVGSFKPNAWGLYDMIGNVWEWCWDWYGSYGTGTQLDPPGPASGSYRVLRGGAWYNSGQNLRSANRYNYTPAYGNSYIGFRLARSGDAGWKD